MPPSEIETWRNDLGRVASILYRIGEQAEKSRGSATYGLGFQLLEKDLKGGDLDVLRWLIHGTDELDALVTTFDPIGERELIPTDVLTLTKKGFRLYRLLREVASIALLAEHDREEAEAKKRESDPTCPDHWHCSPDLAAHACEKVDRSGPCPTCGDRYTPAVLAVYCSSCQAPVGEPCRIWSDILQRERSLREPHPARVTYAKRRKKKS